jgi:hypothetical protein
MITIKLRTAAITPTLVLVLGGALAYQVRATDPPDRSEPRAVDARKSAAGLSAEQFDKIRSLIKPKPGGFDDIAWMTDLWEARKKAAAEGKPLLVWVGDGHPLGWT